MNLLPIDAHLPLSSLVRRAAKAAGTLLGAMALAATPPAQADDYPSKPLRFIVPYGPGGPTDLIARTIAEPLAQRLKQPVIVENKPGASGAIGTDFVTRTPPDGYTLLLSNIGDTVTVALGVKVPYDYLRDLQPVSLLGKTPFVLVAGPQLKAHSVQELIEYAKKNPGTINFGSSGTGSASQLAGELFVSMAGFTATHIPYKGQADATVGLIGGQLAFMFANPVNTLSHIQSGALRALAVSEARRYPTLPDVPTVAESGLPGYDVSAWFGLMTTAGTPEPVVGRLSKEVREILAMPEIREKLARLGVAAQGNTPQEFTTYIEQEIARWTKVVQDAGISVQQ
ncbi:tripartite tricarboxylate transporter substrate binding protein [Bordetella petrii]|nr:tripartite tricarboxylate transporter substrate binding protein [Bordetella petrii]